MGAIAEELEEYVIEVKKELKEDELAAINLLKERGLLPEDFNPFQQKLQTVIAVEQIKEGK